MPSANEQAVRTLKVSATYEDVRRLSAELQAFSAEFALPPEVSVDLELALVEAANNIVQHGYQGTFAGSLEMNIETDAASVTVTLRDRGVLMPPGLMSGDAEMPSFDMESGRGIAIMQACVDRLDYATSGGVNMLRMTKFLPRD